MSVDLLAIDTFFFTPHLETSGEICINEHRAGSSVSYVFVDVDNPDDNPCSPLSALIGTHKRQKVNQLRHRLSANGVTLIAQPQLEKSSFPDARVFAETRVATLDDLKRLPYKGAALGLVASCSLISHTGDD